MHSITRQIEKVPKGPAIMVFSKWLMSYAVIIARDAHQLDHSKAYERLISQQTLQQLSKR